MEKNEQRKHDFILIRSKMRGILDDPESHPRDKVQAGRLLRQVCSDEASESTGEFWHVDLNTITQQ